MLISHRKHFIFIKTVKTAGTSVESYFEKYCMPVGEWSESHQRSEYVSEAGIIGYRGKNPEESSWYNHMPAEHICNRIGQDIWDSYFKFTIVRNPFDKLISAFFMIEKQQKKSYSQRLISGESFTVERGKPFRRITGNTEVDRFRSWIRLEGAIAGLKGTLMDRDKYLIHGKICVDYFIRFEELHEGLAHVCEHLSIPFEPFRLPEFKKGIRHYRTSIRDYYDNETEDTVRQLYAWEFEKFGYDLPPAGAKE